MSEQTPEARLEQLGITLPAASPPAARYANYVIAGGLLFLSGKGPSSRPKGKLGKEFTTEEGYRFARQTGLEVLAVLQDALGSLSRIKRVVKVQGFVNADPAFEEPHKVLDGFSELMHEVFGEKGNHARSVLGASTLRDGLPIVVDSIYELED
ncbi:RidA family protein [Paenibacillus koleovorans]|uniref:RidA family protein n=1 Tax=Paenibacillus koleovorans TaxID=121608 RepID=UPI000FDAEE62|nr:RidA family protein [Paenibacillus koleovorans]